MMLALLMMFPLSASASVTESSVILVNKNVSLPSDYVPSDLIRPEVEYAQGVPESRRQMRAEAAHALEELFAAAQNDGITLLAISGYRSYWTQRDIYERRLKEAGQEHVSLYVAKPGESEHQTGLAMDLGCPGCTDLTERFAETDAYQWLTEHAVQYGFIIRYPENGTEQTGYAFEPWHVRYLGKAAESVAQSGLTFEEWYAERISGSSICRDYEFRLGDLLF